MGGLKYRVRFLRERRASAPGHSVAWTSGLACSELRKRFYCANEPVGQSVMLLQNGVELSDHDTPSPHHDVFVMNRPAADTATRVTFREPGDRSFELDLPLNSTLASVKIALVSARLRRKPSANGRLPLSVAGGHHPDCTLVVRGTTMSESLLLGDYLMTFLPSGAHRSQRKMPPAVLVLWRQQPQGEGGGPATNHLRHDAPSQVSRTASVLGVWGLPSKSIGNISARYRHKASSPAVQGLGDTQRWKPRRSVQRRAKSVVGLSGMKRGARCGLGIRPLLAASPRVGVGGDERRANRRGEGCQEGAGEWLFFRRLFG